VSVGNGSKIGSRHRQPAADGAAPHAVRNSNGLPNGLPSFCRESETSYFSLAWQAARPHLETFD